ncbi:MAG: S9 family peptidase [Pseudomonadota bacterium]
MTLRFATLLAAAVLPAFAATAAAPAETGTPAAQTRSAFTAADLVRMNRLSDLNVAPDGRQVAYVVRRTESDAGRSRSAIFLLDLTKAGAAPRQLTHSDGNDSSPRWSPDGRSLFFLSTRSGSSQVWRLALDGGEAVQLSQSPLPINALKVAPDGGHLLVSMDVFPDCKDLACSKERFDNQKNAKSSGVLFDQLFIRHWDRWEDGSFAHLYSLALDASGRLGEDIDLMRGMRANVPSRPMGGEEEFTFSPDGKRVVFSARLATPGEAWSTNFDLYQAAADGSTPLLNLTQDNPAWDTQPVFLADGRLAYLAMSRAGFEADRFRIMLRNSGGSAREVAPSWDRSPSRLGTSYDGRRLQAIADDDGQTALFEIDPAKGRVQRLATTGQVTEFAGSRPGNVVALATLDSPADLFLLPARGAAQRLTAVNAAVQGARFEAQYEQFHFKGADEESVSGYVMKPFGYVAGRKYPIAYLIHGGPQSTMGNNWSYRWNPKVFAGAGYAVVFIDFHGSSGYGQKFTDSISQDWGGKPFIDVQRGLAAAIERYPFLDGDRACALGPSYGGYMINWIAGNWPDRFRCLVNHDGVFDTRGMYYASEELWFTEWENGGTYFEQPAKHEKFNPALLVANWRTPMLVIHGERDFRVPDTQGIGTFTALQRRGIKSKLLFFPDENHWVLKPANSELWHKTVFEWLAEFLKPGGD